MHLLPFIGKMDDEGGNECTKRVMVEPASAATVIPHVVAAAGKAKPAISKQQPKPKSQRGGKAGAAKGSGGTTQIGGKGKSKGKSKGKVAGKGNEQVGKVNEQVGKGYEQVGKAEAEAAAGSAKTTSATQQKKAAMPKRARTSKALEMLCKVGTCFSSCLSRARLPGAPCGLTRPPRSPQSPIYPLFLNHLCCSCVAPPRRLSAALNCCTPRCHCCRARSSKSYRRCSQTSMYSCAR